MEQKLEGRMSNGHHSLVVWIFRGCPRCGGDLYRYLSPYTCFQCGHEITEEEYASLRVDYLISQFFAEENTMSLKKSSQTIEDHAKEICQEYLALKESGKKPYRAAKEVGEKYGLSPNGIYAALLHEGHPEDVPPSVVKMYPKYAGRTPQPEPETDEAILEAPEEEVEDEEEKPEKMVRAEQLSLDELIDACGSVEAVGELLLSGFVRRVNSLVRENTRLKNDRENDTELVERIGSLEAEKNRLELQNKDQYKEIQAQADKIQELEEERKKLQTAMNEMTARKGLTNLKLRPNSDGKGSHFEEGE